MKMTKYFCYCVPFLFTIIANTNLHGKFQWDQVTHLFPTNTMCTTLINFANMSSQICSRLSLLYVFAATDLRFQECVICSQICNFNQGSRGQGHSHYILSVKFWKNFNHFVNCKWHASSSCTSPLEYTLKVNMQHCITKHENA